MKASTLESQQIVQTADWLFPVFAKEKILVDIGMRLLALHPFEHVMAYYEFTGTFNRCCFLRLDFIASVCDAEPSRSTVRLQGLYHLLTWSTFHRSPPMVAVFQVLHQTLESHLSMSESVCTLTGDRRLFRDEKANLNKNRLKCGRMISL